MSVGSRRRMFNRVIAIYKLIVKEMQVDHMTRKVYYPSCHLIDIQPHIPADGGKDPLVAANQHYNIRRR